MKTFRVVGFYADGSRFQAAESETYERAVQIRNALLGSEAFESITIEHEEIHPPVHVVPAPFTGTDHG